MTLQEKIGQMTQAERGAVASDPTLVAQWDLGSVLSGGGSTPAENTPSAWVAMVNQFQQQALSTRLGIPMIYGIDTVHGTGNVYGATIFPHNIGMGASRDPALSYAEGKAAASETLATGIPWAFGPCVCVTRDERWGRSYESYGEDPALVQKMQTEISGFQNNGVLATAKHFAGDGDTLYNTAIAQANQGQPWYNKKYPIDQGVTTVSKAHFLQIDLAPYTTAVKQQKVGSVMPSFSSIDYTDDGVGNPVKMHANQDLITGYLKGKLGFKGFVISDWEGIHQIPDPSDPTNTGLTPYKVRTGVNAGIDMFMEPNTAPQFEQLLLDEVNAGRVSMSRINDAVSRILRAKFDLGLFEHPYASTGNTADVGSAAHRAVARQAAAESQVLLKNSGNLLPLKPGAKVYVAGRNADDIGNQAGGWTIAWQGESGSGVIPGTTILQGMKAADPNVTYSEDGSAPTAGSDVGVVVVGETPYAEGYGDVGGPECGFCTPAQLESKSLSLQPGDKAVVDKVCSAIKKCVVLVVSGRPQIVTDQLPEISALVASWLPGSEGAGVADVLFGKKPFTGRLPVSWPASESQVPINVGDANYQPLFPFGWGLRTRASGHVPNTASALNAAHGKGDSKLVDEIIARERDAAEANVIAGHAPSNWQALIADAEHAQLVGDPVKAFVLLARAAS